MAKELTKQDYALQTWVKNDILRAHSLPVKKITKKTKEFAETLMDKLYEYDWVGLAAPQVWVLERIIAVTFRKTVMEENEVTKKKEERLEQTWEVVMINPVITSKSDEKFLFEEACLSVPWKTGNVLRHRHIKVDYMTVDWKKHTKKLSDMNSVIVQHEIDHLDGILFVDEIVE